MYQDDMLLTPLEVNEQEDPSMNPSEFFITSSIDLKAGKLNVRIYIGQHLRRISMYILMNFLVYYQTIKMVLQKDIWEYLARCSQMQ